MTGVRPFPAAFKNKKIVTAGAKIHVRVGGTGPAVVLLHGFGDTGDMWAPKIEELEALHVETRYFLDCINNNMKPFNDGYAGLRVVRILEAAEQSLKQHKEILYA